jgi:hypothetical protein
MWYFRPFVRNIWGGFKNHNLDENNRVTLCGGFEQEIIMTFHIPRPLLNSFWILLQCSTVTPGELYILMSVMAQTSVVLPRTYSSLLSNNSTSVLPRRSLSVMTSDESLGKGRGMDCGGMWTRNLWMNAMNASTFPFMTCSVWTLDGHFASSVARTSPSSISGRERTFGSLGKGESAPECMQCKEIKSSVWSESVFS